MALRVLVVDDEPAVRDILSRLLGALGHRTATAASAGSALAMLRVERFDVMLCDIRMPEVSGLDLVPLALEIDDDLAVLMLTGVNELTTANEALAAGAIDYLVKPVELAELEHAVQRAAQRRALRIVRRTGEGPAL